MSRIFVSVWLAMLTLFILLSPFVTWIYKSTPYSFVTWGEAYLKVSLVLLWIWMSFGVFLVVWEYLMDWSQKE